MSAARWRRRIAKATALAALAGGLSGCCQSGWTNFIFRAECSDHYAAVRVKLIAPDEPVIAGRPVRLRVEVTIVNPDAVPFTADAHYYWDLDGDREIDQHVTRPAYDWISPVELEHRFPRPGRVRVGVEFTVDKGRDSDALFIDVQPPPGIESAPTSELPAPSPSPAPPGNVVPTAAFRAPAEVPVNRPFALDATGSSDADGRIVRYVWDMEGDATPERETSSPITEYRYVTAGTKTATLTVVDDHGATAQAQHEIVVVGARGGAQATAAAARTSARR